MIYEALHYVVRDLNAYLKRKFMLPEDKAILGTILDEKGTVPEGNKEKVLITLVNLEQETNFQYTNYQKTTAGADYSLNTPFNFNMDVLVTGLFSDYAESLKFLSEAIYFFQAKNVFNHQNSPGLDDRIQQLTFEVIKLSYHEAHSLWTALGAKYMPSVLLKVRMLSFQSDEIQQADVRVTTTGKSVNPDNQ